MKRLIVVLFILMSISSCESKNEYGQCVGFGNQNQNQKYETSINNAIVAFIFIETIIVPILWATDYVYCPISE